MSQGPKTALTVGTFDGVHLGHRSLLARARGLAGPGGRVVVLAFDPHPLRFLRPASAPGRLSTWRQKEARLRQAGADVVEKLDPSPDILDLAPTQFMERIAREFKPSFIVEGADFRFGRARAGDIDLLARIGAQRGFSVHALDDVHVALTDHTTVRASSTMCRWLLAHGRVADAARLLGSPHTLDAVVVRGDRRGRTIGFPTANLSTDCLTPLDGIYAGRAVLENGRRYHAAVHIGERPTFEKTAPSIEAYLFDPATVGGPLDRPTVEWAPLPGLPEYGWSVQLELVAWVRETLRFESVDGLVRQMNRDCAAAAAVLSTPGGIAPASCKPDSDAGPIARTA